MSIANNLRQLRLNSGMTQQQVAEKIGITRQALSSYESSRTCPDINMLLKLSEVYGTDIDGVVYGQERSLKLMRIIKKISGLLFAILSLLTLVSSLLLWSANHFYAISTGELTAEEKVILESRIRLTGAWETVDSIILTIAFVGFLLLIVLLATWKCGIPMKIKVAYIVTLAITLIVIAAFWGVNDSVFLPVNYLITPMLVITRIIFLFVIHLVIDFFLRKRSKQPIN